MEDFNKNQIILILIVLNLIFFVSTVSLGRQVHRKGIMLNEERSVRFDLEAKEAEFSKTLSKCEEKARSSAAALEEEKAAHQATKQALVETQDELNKVTKLKETLEEDLKEALTKKSRK